MPVKSLCPSLGALALLCLSACDPDRDGDRVPESRDCDDGDPDVSPHALELCDGLDNDCDDEVDEGLIVDGFADRDGDGHGDPNEAFADCSAVEVADDCDDADASVHPQAQETCDGIDQDCDGEVDDDPSDGLTFHPDADGDGFGDPRLDLVACSRPEGYAEDASDCDDTAATAHPGAVEVCDGADSDCDGFIPEIRVPEDYADVQAAIDAAADGDMVCVGPGTWARFDFRGKAILVRGTDGPAETIVDGGGAGRVLAFSSGEGPDSILSGFTVTGGLFQEGAGVTIVASSPTLEDVVVTGNRCPGNDGPGADCRGAGMLVADGASPILRGVAITGNEVLPSWSARAAGLAVADASATLDGCTIADNVLEVGDTVGIAMGAGLYVDGDSDVVVRRSVLARNHTTGEIPNFAIGGAAFVHAPARLTVENSWIVGNTLVGDYSQGAGIATDAWKGQPDVEISVSNVIFAGNFAGDPGINYAYGAAIHAHRAALEVRNCAFLGNAMASSFVLDGSALAIDFGSADVTGSVFVDNRFGGEAWVLEGSVAYAEEADVSFAYSDVFDDDEPAFHGFTNPVGLYGNIASDPAFADVSDADPLRWDLHPTEGSPLVDAGDPAVLDPDGTRSDIGPFGGPLGESW